ncbi:MAG: SET domain-containing protein-lysine N-methyltransferase [Anaerolineales bacterium]|nr:SET domain-containing protein-lysine N-methyltransferase [Anaerolineales bacterium]
MPNVIVRRSGIQGSGVFAAKHFRKGEVVLQIDDSYVVTGETTLTSDDWEFNADFFDGKIVIMQEPERCINHCCDPNTYVKTIEGVRNVLACRDITEGEEITYDYAINGDNEGTFPCHCGAKRCRKTYIGNYFKLPMEFQLEYLPYLDKWFQQQYQKEIAVLKNFGNPQ